MTESVILKFWIHPESLKNRLRGSFGANVNFTDIGDGNVLTSVKVNENDIRYWARLYASQIKITEPKELVDMCKQDMVNALKLYDV